MSRTDIAKHCGELAVGVAVLSFGVTEGAATGAIAAISLASVWRDMKSACVPTARKAAVAATLDALDRNREFPAEAIATAAALLAHPPATAAFMPDDTIALLAADRFVKETADRLPAMMKAGDTQVEAVLTLAFSAALTACVTTRDFRASLHWDVDLATLQVVHRLESLFGDALRRLQQTSDLADGQIIQMAKRLIPNVRTREEAIAAIDQFVEAAQRIDRRGHTPSNHPDFIDRVFAEVARLNADDRPDDAAAALRAALAEERDGSEARQGKFLEGLRDQYILGQNAQGYADVTEQLLRLGDTENVFRRLCDAGERRCKTGVSLGIAFDIRIAVAIWLRCSDIALTEEQRGWSLNALGIALSILGQRGDVAALNEAVAAYRAALEVHTREALPVDWARTQNNLGNALMTLGARGDEVALHDAVAAFRAALEVRTREALPADWAETQNNLGNALRIFGERGDVAALHEAIAAYRVALEVRTRKALPMAWAGTQNNLGIALSILGERGDDAALREAVAAYRGALEVWSREALPIDWAGTQNNLGTALRTLGQRGDNAALHDAISAYHFALEVHTQKARPVDWAMTRHNMAHCFIALAFAEPERAADHLAQALTAIDDALEIYTADDVPFYHQKAIELRARILAAGSAT